MTAKIDLVNYALIMLGEQTIASLTQDDKAARLVGSVYNLLLDNELCGHPWHFATKNTLLVKMPNEEINNGFNKYLLPLDCLQAKEFYSQSKNIDISNEIWQEGGVVYSKYPAPIYIHYIAQILDINIYPAFFKELLATRIALEIAQALTQSNEKYFLILKKYQEVSRKARRLNAYATPAEYLAESSWLN